MPVVAAGEKRPLPCEVAKLDKELLPLVRERRASAQERELELRVGATDADGNFIPGVSAAEFEQLEAELASSDDLDGDREWRQVIDYQYILPSGERARTRVECDVQGMALCTQHVIKEAVCDVVVVDGSARDEEDEEDDGGVGHAKRSSRLGARLALAIERQLVMPPAACLTTNVRLKHRKQFRDVRDGNLVWVYELSRTWSGSTRVAVERMQKEGKTTYEVECELVDASGAYLRQHSDDGYVVASLLEKTRALLGTDDALRHVCSRSAKVRKKRK